MALELIIGYVVIGLCIYLLSGLLFAIIFLWKGIEKVDAGTKETGLYFKLLITPGLILFWIPLLVKWIKSN